MDLTAKPLTEDFHVTSKRTQLEGQACWEDQTDSRDPSKLP